MKTQPAKFYLITENQQIVEYNTLDELLNIEKIYHEKNLYHPQIVIHGTRLDIKTLRTQQQRKETP